MTGSAVTFVSTSSRKPASESRKFNAGPAPVPVSFLLPANRLLLTR
jgi:hypothetical protein